MQVCGGRHFFGVDAWSPYLHGSIWSSKCGVWTLIQRQNWGEVYVDLFFLFRSQYLHGIAFGHDPIIYCIAFDELNRYIISMQKVLVTGAQGFMAGYIIPELLGAGFSVIGVDNQSKHGAVSRSYEADDNFTLHIADAKDERFLTELLLDCDHFVCAAALVGGAGYVYEFAHDVYVENEQISIAAIRSAIQANANGRLQKLTYIISSMVYESLEQFPAFRVRYATLSTAT